MRELLIQRLARLRHHCHKYAKAYHALHECTHIGYFGCVAFSGPYQIPALALGALVIIGWILHLESTH